MLRRVADDGDDDGRDEEVRQTDGVSEALERVHEHFAHERGGEGREREHSERERERPCLFRGRLVVRCGMQFQICARDHDVQREQHGRDREGDDVERMPVGIAVPTGDRGHEQHHDRREHEAELEEQRAAVELAIAADDHRDPEHEEDVRDDRAGQ